MLIRFFRIVKFFLDTLINCGTVLFFSFFEMINAATYIVRSISKVTKTQLIINKFNANSLINPLTNKTIKTVPPTIRIATNMYVIMNIAKNGIPKPYFSFLPFRNFPNKNLHFFIGIIFVNPIPSLNAIILNATATEIIIAEKIIKAEILKKSIIFPPSHIYLCATKARTRCIFICSTI